MNNKLICPFCQQEYIIHKDDSCFGQQRCVCRNPNCEFDGWHFPVKLVSELIRTRKALDVALCSLQDIAESDGDFITGASTPLDEHEYADMMLKEIKRQMKIKTALEQKE